MTNSRSKAKSIALPVSEISENLVQDPNISPLLDEPAPSALLQGAIDQQERELTELQARMDELSEQYATRARLIVLRGLETGRQKAQAQILTIDLPAFFDTEGNGSGLPSGPNPALAPSIEGTTEC